MNRKAVHRAGALGALVCFLAGSGVAIADSITYVGSGINAADDNPKGTVAGEADFTVTKTGTNTFDIQLVLRNITKAQTGGVVLQQADILDGVVFTISPTSIALSYDASTNPTLHTGSNYYASQSDWESHNPSNAAANANLAGTWSGTLSSTALGNHGVGATGFGNTFSMSGVAGGNPGSTNYGLANNNYPLANNDFKHFPYVLNALNFDFTVTGVSSLSASQITGVKFLFGTEGTGIIVGGPVPEPGTLALAAIGVVGIAAWRRQSRKWAAPAV